MTFSFLYGLGSNQVNLEAICLNGRLKFIVIKILSTFPWNYSFSHVLHVGSTSVCPTVHFPVFPVPVSVAGVEQTFSRSDIMFPVRLNGLAALSIEDQLSQRWTLGTREVILPRRKFANAITLTICIIFFPPVQMKSEVHVLLVGMRLLSVFPRQLKKRWERYRILTCSISDDVWERKAVWRSRWGEGALPGLSAPWAREVARRTAGTREVKMWQN